MCIQVVAEMLGLGEKRYLSGAARTCAAPLGAAGTRHT